MKRIRTVILEDQFFQQMAIKTILDLIPEYEIIGIYKYPMDALNNCKEKKPDLIILDAELGGDKDAGPNWARNIRKELSTVCILGLTVWPECVEKLIQAGCDDALLKGQLGNVDEMQAYLKEARYKRTFNYITIHPPKLSENERKVLHMLREGASEVEIASELFGGVEKTRKVKDVKKNLFNIFGARNSHQLIAIAYDVGYLKPKYIEGK